jgi:hypothetical protein
VGPRQIPTAVSELLESLAECRLLAGDERRLRAVRGRVRQPPLESSFLDLGIDLGPLDTDNTCKARPGWSGVIRSRLAHGLVDRRHRRLTGGCGATKRNEAQQDHHDNKREHHSSHYLMDRLLSTYKPTTL